MDGRYSIEGLAERFSARLVGDGSKVVTCVADLEQAKADAVSFFVDRRLRRQLETTQAGVVILAEKDLNWCNVPALVCDNPHALFAEVAALLHPDEDTQQAGAVHATAVVDVSANIHPTAIIEANAVIGAGCLVEAGVYIGPGCVLRQRVHIGAHSKLTANVTVCRDCKLGQRVLVHPGAVIGSDGFGFAHRNDTWIKIPQLGAVTVGHDVEIGACVAIDRGALRDTVIEDGVKLDNQIHVAHNVTIGANSVMAAQSGIAGSSRIGRNCAIAGAVGISGHVDLADRTTVYAFSLVSQSIDEPGIYAGSAPLESVAHWRRNRVRYKQLDEMARKLKDLESKLEKLGKK